jgi:hypothetical protein
MRRQLLRELVFLGRQGVFEVGESTALALEQSAFDLMDEDATAPAVLGGLPRVPFALHEAFYEVD